MCSGIRDWLRADVLRAVRLSSAFGLAGETLRQSGSQRRRTANVSFVIAVYNGEKFLERKLRTIFAQNYPRELMEILVISAGSTDHTDDIARSFAAEGVKFLRVPRGGKAAALNAGVPLVSGEILVIE